MRCNNKLLKRFNFEIARSKDMITRLCETISVACHEELEYEDYRGWLWDKPIEVFIGEWEIIGVVPRRKLIVFVSELGEFSIRAFEVFINMDELEAGHEPMNKQVEILIVENACDEVVEQIVQTMRLLCNTIDVSIVTDSIDEVWGSGNQFQGAT